MKKIIAGVFIVNKKRELLICHPTNHSDTLWSIPKGMVEDGEMLIDAAIRETFEETNIDLTGVSGLEPLPSVVYKNNKKMLYPYLCWEPSVTGLNWYTFDIKCNSNVPIEAGGFLEMDDFKFVTLDEARVLLHESQVGTIDDIIKIIG